LDDRPRDFSVNAEKSQLFAIAFSGLYVEMSRVVTEKFHGDLSLFLVLVTIANTSVSSAARRSDFENRYGSLATPIEEEYAFIQLLPLSQIVGLPRTTVRRKVEKLVDLGFIEHRRGRGYRLLKRRMAESPVIVEILGAQYSLLRRLLRLLVERDIISMSDVNRPGGPKIRSERIPTPTPRSVPEDA
jgi:hypothetical protein